MVPCWFTLIGGRFTLHMLAPCRQLASIIPRAAPATLLAGFLCACSQTLPPLTTGVVETGDIHLESPALPAPAPRAARELATSPDVTVEPGQAYQSSEGVEWGLDGSVLLDPSPGEIEYLIYRLGDFLPADRLLNCHIEAVPRTEGAPVSEYYFLIGDYAQGRWQTQGPLAANGVVQTDPALPFAWLSPDSALYAAIVVPPGQAVRFYGLTAHFDLSGRGVDHLYAAIPSADSTGVDIALWLEARNQSDTTEYAFNGPATLRSDPPGLTVLTSPEFVNGWSRPLVRFEEPGDYTLYLEGSLPRLNGELGSVHVYTTQLPVYSLYLDQARINYLNDNPWDKTPQDGGITIAGQSFPSVGLRYRGDSALWLWKKNWKVEFPKGTGYFDQEWGYERDELNLNAECVDPTMMREKLSYDLMEDMGLLAPRARFIHLRLNDVYQGLYVDVEDPDKRFLASRGVPNGGAIYKPQWCIMDVQGDGSPAAYVGPFDKKTREAEPYDDLAALIWDINNVWQAGNCWAAFKATFDEERFLQYMVANTLVSDGDQLGKNYILYHEDQVSDQWMVIPWDYDLSWGHHYTSEYGLFCEPMFYDTPLDMGGYQSTYAAWRGVNNLLDRYVYDPVLFGEFKARLALDMETYFEPASMLARIDAYYALVAEDAHADWQRWVFGTYEERVEELRSYVWLRRAFLSTQLGQ